MAQKKFSGIYTALVTPQDDQGVLDAESLDNLVKSQLAAGINGFFVTGSTGEAFLLNTEERMEVLDAVIASNQKQAKVIAHIGSISTQEAVKLAKHAGRAGAHAISALVPFYIKLAPEEIVKHYEEIMSAVDIPLIIYNNPNGTGVNLTPDLIERISRNPKCVGVKFTSSNLYEMQQIRARCGEDFVIYNGYEDIYAGGAIIAADGAIGSTFNIMPHHLVDMYARIVNYDWMSVQEHQYDINEMVGFLNRYDAIPFLKYVLYLQGILKNTHSRMPLRKLSSEEQLQIRQFYETNAVLKRSAV